MRRDIIFEANGVYPFRLTGCVGQAGPAVRRRPVAPQPAAAAAETESRALPS